MSAEQEQTRSRAQIDLGGGIRPALEGTLVWADSEATPAQPGIPLPGEVLLDTATPEVPVVLGAELPINTSHVGGIALARGPLAEADARTRSDDPMSSRSIMPIREGDPVPHVPRVLPYNRAAAIERGKGADPRLYSFSRVGRRSKQS